MHVSDHGRQPVASPPSRGAWIEIRMLWLLNLPSCRRPPRGGRGLKCPCTPADRQYQCRPPRGGRGLKCSWRPRPATRNRSPPSRGAWIEIKFWPRATPVRKSPPSRGAWIEIQYADLISAERCRSPPSRGAWIEIPGTRPLRTVCPGSPPSRGAWIEISVWFGFPRPGCRRPPRGGRGLKYDLPARAAPPPAVAPLAEA